MSLGRTEAGDNFSTSELSICRLLIIIGGGLGGVATAIALARSGHQVTVLEAQDDFKEIGAGIQMPPNSTKVFKAWCLLDTLNSHASEPQDMVYRSYRDGSLLSRVRLMPDMETMFGAAHLLVHRADAIKILVQEAKRLGVAFQLESPVSDVNFSTPSVTTARGEHFTADAIIAADGERSVCRSALLGQPDLPDPTGKLVYRLTIKLQDMRQDPELLSLIEPSRVFCWLGPGAHLVCYTLNNNDMFNVALTWPDPIMGRIQFGPRKAEIGELRQLLGGWDPILQKLLDLAQEASYWTLLQAKENHTWTHVDGKFVLIGDAAHAMTPYLAQGASQAIEDGAVIGRLFSKIQHKGQIPDLLIVYQNLRLPRCSAIQTKAAKMGQVLQLLDGPRQRERDRQLREQPFDGYPNSFGDPAVQKWLYDYDCYEVADRAWEKYMRGEWLGTAPNLRMQCLTQFG